MMLNGEYNKGAINRVYMYSLAHLLQPMQYHVGTTKSCYLRIYFLLVAYQHI
jgi:hypothetical protein